RMLALLRQRRVVNDKHRIRATDQSIRLHDKLALERRLVPNAGANKMMQLIVVGCRCPRRLQAFRDGLRELGHFEGRTSVIEYRSAAGDGRALPALAAEL